MELTLDDVINSLENIKSRIVDYDRNLPHYPDDYKTKLIEVDTAAIDTAIAILKNRE